MTTHHRRTPRKYQLVFEEPDVRLLVGALAAMLWELNRQGNANNPYYKQLRNLERQVCDQTGFCLDPDSPDPL